MQDTTITLAVDILNNGTTTNRVYTRSDHDATKSTYRGPNASLTARDQMSLYRTPPKRSGNYLGSAKTSVKFTEDKLVENADGSGQTPAPLICEVSFSEPVGVSDADRLAFRQRVIAAIDVDAMMDKLQKFLEI